MKHLPAMYIQLGKLIKAKRNELNLSLDELAYRCGLHLNCIWKIENAKSEIKLSTLISIFRELDLRVGVIDNL